MIKICIDCKISELKPGNAKRCIACGNDHVRKSRKTRYSKKNVFRNCVTCQKEYKTTHSRQKYCQNPCGSKNVNEKDRWLSTKKPLKCKAALHKT